VKTIAIPLALILLAGTLVVPIGFSEAQVSELTVPNPPTNLTAIAVSSNQTNLSWTAPVNSTIDQVNGYKIEIRPLCLGSFSPLVMNTTNTTTTYSNTGLAEGTCYEYQVFALNPAGTGNASNSASATTWTVPSTPTSLTAIPVSQSQLNLNWTASSNTGGTPLTGYKIERRDSCAGNFSTLVANTGNTSTTYSNTGLVNGTCYEYRVFSHNVVGTSLASNNATATTLQNPAPSTTSPPSAPTGLNVTTLSKAALKLTWSASSNAGGAPILGYQIQRNGTTIVNNTNNTQTNYTNSGLLPLHQQTYRVAAWNSAGLGPYSSNATGTTNNQTSIIQTGTSIIPTSTSNLGQQVSSFVHQYNDLFKMQRDLTIKKITECNEKLRSATPENRIQIKANCKADLKTIKEQFKDARKQFKEDFKVFRETAKSLIKVAKQNEIISAGEVKELKKELKSFEKATKKAKKEFKEDIKEAKKEIKHEEKQFKKELKELKKEEKEHEKELKKEAKKTKKDKHDDDNEDD